MSFKVRIGELEVVTETARDAAEVVRELAPLVAMAAERAAFSFSSDAKPRPQPLQTARDVSHKVRPVDELRGRAKNPARLIELLEVLKGAGPSGLDNRELAKRLGLNGAERLGPPSIMLDRFAQECGVERAQFVEILRDGRYSRWVAGPRIDDALLSLHRQLRPSAHKDLPSATRRSEG